MGNKTTNGTVVCQASKVLVQNLFPLSRKFPKLIPEESLTNVHPLVKKMFSGKIPNLQLAGRLAHFSKNWPRSGNFIFSKGVHDTILNSSSTNDYSTTCDNVQNTEILNRSGDYRCAGQRSHKKSGTLMFPGIDQFTDQFLSNILLVKKKDGVNRPCINLKALNKFIIQYKHFKMEGLHCLKYLLEKKDFLCKIDLKDSYFSVPLCMSSRKFVRFVWSGNLYEFLCLCFGLGPALRIFSKLLKVPKALLRRLNIRLKIHLDDILLMGRTLEEILMSRDTSVFLLQHLSFVINLKKLVLKPSQQIEFLGLKIDALTMTLTLTEENIEKVILKCQNLLSHSQTNVLELTKLIGLMSSTVQAILSACLKLRYLQEQQLQSLNQACSYQAKTVLKSLSKQELLWRVENLRSNNQRSLGTKFSDTNRCIKIRLGRILQRGVN